jgi:hypothetical protein
MKTLTALVLSAATLMSAAPVLAQPAPGEWTLERRESWLQERLDRAASDGALTRHDAKRAEKTLTGIMDRQAHLVSADGGQLRPSDRQELQGRLDQLDGTLNWAHKEDAPPWRR